MVVPQVPKPKDYIYAQVQVRMLSTSPRTGSFTVEECNTVSHGIFWESMMV